MNYPEDMTADDIMEFEYEYNRYLDRFLPESLIAVNEELQEIAHDELERDWDEAYEPEINDNWYDEQYEVDADYV